MVTPATAATAADAGDMNLVRCLPLKLGQPSNGALGRTGAEEAEKVGRSSAVAPPRSNAKTKSTVEHNASVPSFDDDRERGHIFGSDPFPRDAHRSSRASDRHVTLHCDDRGGHDDFTCTDRSRARRKQRCAIPASQLPSGLWSSVHNGSGTNDGPGQRGNNQRAAGAPIAASAISGRKSQDDRVSMKAAEERCRHDGGDTRRDYGSGGGDGETQPERSELRTGSTVSVGHHSSAHQRLLYQDPDRGDVARLSGSSDCPVNYSDALRTSRKSWKGSERGERTRPGEPLPLQEDRDACVALMPIEKLQLPSTSHRGRKTEQDGGERTSTADDTEALWQQRQEILRKSLSFCIRNFES